MGPSATPSPTLLLTKCATPAQLRSASRSPVRSAPPSLTRSQGLPVLRSLLLLRPPLPTLPLLLLLPLWPLLVTELALVLVLVPLESLVLVLSATVLESLATLLESPLWLL